RTRFPSSPDRRPGAYYEQLGPFQCDGKSFHPHLTEGQVPTSSGSKPAVMPSMFPSSPDRRPGAYVSSRLTAPYRGRGFHPHLTEGQVPTPPGYWDGEPINDVSILT